MSGVRLLVCGSRTWADSGRVCREMDMLMPSVVIEGGCRTGADEIAACWASLMRPRVELLIYRANWQRDGKAAGPIRNARMLSDGNPTLGLALGPLWRKVMDVATARALFASLVGSGQMWRATGTGDMVRRMLDARLRVRWVANSDAPTVELEHMPGPPS